METIREKNSLNLDIDQIRQTVPSHLQNKCCIIIGQAHFISGGNLHWHKLTKKCSKIFGQAWRPPPSIPPFWEIKFC